MPQCVACGTALREGSKFCGKCGARQVAGPDPAPQVSQDAGHDEPIPVPTSPAPEIEVDKCPNCGKTLVPGASTCWACGEVLGPQPPARTFEAELPPQPLPFPVGVPQFESRGVPTGLVVAGAAVVVVVAALVPIHFLRRTPDFLDSARKAQPAAQSVQPTPASSSKPLEPSPKREAPTGPAPTTATGTQLVETSPGDARPDRAVLPTKPEVPPTEQHSIPIVPSNSAANVEPPSSRNEPRRVEILRPDPVPQPASTAAQPRYEGPPTGTIIWSGMMERNQTIVIDGPNVSSGSLRGDFLPGVPVQVEVQPSDVAVGEPPSPSNGFRRLVFRSRAKRNIVVTITWRVL
jgi:hypothetical protein